MVKMADGKLKNIQEKIAALRRMAKQVAKALQELKRSPAPVCPAAKPRRSSA
jgi:hypothetical protein